MDRNSIRRRLHGAWQAVGACAVLALAGCGGGGGGSSAPVPVQPPVPPVHTPAPPAGPAQPPAPGNDPAPDPDPAPAPPPASGVTAAYAYVTRETADAIGVYALDSGTGGLSASSTATLTAGSAPRHTAYDAVNRRLYIASYGRNRIEVADVDAATGGLSQPVLASPLSEPVRLVVEAQGRFLYAAFGGQHGSLSGVMAFRINADGSLTDVNFHTTHQRPTALALDPSGRHAFLATYWGVLTPYAVNATTGALTPGIITPMGMSDLAYDATGDRLYASNGLSTHTHVFDVQPGASFTMQQMMSMSGMPTSAIALDPAGSYLYTLDPFHGAVQTLRIAASNGQVSAASTLTLAAGCTPQALAAAPDGHSVHVACQGGALLGHAVDRGTGALSPLAGSPSGVGGGSITFVPVR